MNKSLSNHLSILAFTAALGFSGAAGAGLINRGGLIYDDVLDITWLQNANYGAGSSYDDGSDLTDGRMTWQNAVDWAANLSYFDNVRNQTLMGWRLPTVEPIGASFNYNFSNNASTDWGSAKTTTNGTDGGWRDGAGNPVSEMGYMYYVNLANKGQCTPNDAFPGSCTEQSGWGLVNTGPFIKLQADAYWNPLAGRPFRPFEAWNFDFFNGGQDANNKVENYYAWAVRNGDVVPEPASIALVGLGLAALGWARQRRG